MRYIHSICLLLASSAILTSCTKVIDVKLNDADKKYVIEGILTDQPGTTSIHITQTKNFNQDNTFPGVAGATVTITDNSSGVTTTLAETAPGTYTDAALAGAPGKTYIMKVVVGGQTFTALSTMPVKKNLDSLYITRDNVFGDIYYLANISFRDPAGMGDSYYCTQFVNGKKTDQIFVTNDDYFDNRQIESKLYMNPGGDEKDKIKPGDTVKIDFMCIDPTVYKYWFSLQQSATGSNQSAAPANPVTNIKGGALGYFTAQTLQTKSVIVQ